MNNPCKMCFLILSLLGCGENVRETRVNKVKSTNPIRKSEETKSINFPINEIIKNSHKRKLNYDLEYILPESTTLNKIDSAFFKNYLAHYSIKNIKDYKLKYNEHLIYYFFDYVEFDNYVSFTIVQNNTYDDYYNYIYDKLSRKITEVVRIASIGVDGGHSHQECLNYSNSMKELIVKTKSEYGEDFVGSPV